MSVKKIFGDGLVKTVVKYKYIIVIAVVGLLLLSFPSTKPEKSASDKNISEIFSLPEFEKRLENTLTSCRGVGRAKVILTIKSGPESVYAKEERQSSEKRGNGENSDESSDSDIKPSILSVGSGKEEPVVVKQVYPKFQGAVVVCDGADDIKVCSDVTTAVSALTGLTTDKISIIKMKN